MKKLRESRDVDGHPVDEGDNLGGDPPTVFDPFCGGGSTLVEAQRLGLPAAGSDLNPVPLLITRVLTELIPPTRPTWSSTVFVVAATRGFARSATV